jgi:hypothetical protein
MANIRIPETANRIDVFIAFVIPQARLLSANNVDEPICCGFGE